MNFLGTAEHKPGGGTCRYRALTVVVVFTALLFSFPSECFSLHYAVTDLGTLPGGQMSGGKAINNAGSIIGYSDLGGDSYHGFLFARGEITDITGATDGSGALSINIHEDVLVDLGLGRYGKYSNGALTPLTIFDQSHTGNVSCINDAGQIGGIYSSSDYPFYRNMPTRFEPDGSKTFLGYLGGEPATGVDIILTGVSAINNLGWIIGYSSVMPNGFLPHPFISFGGSPIDLSTTGGGASAINYSGEVAGNVSGSSVWKTADQPLNIGAGNHTFGRGINDAGEMVGYTDDPDLGPSKPFVCLYNNVTDAGKTDIKYLNELAYPKYWVLNSANGINEGGQITGDGFNGQLYDHAYLATPFYLQSGEDTASVPTQYAAGYSTVDTGCAMVCAANMARSLIGEAPARYPIRLITPAIMNADLVKAHGYSAADLVWGRVAEVLQGDAPIEYVGAVNVNNEILDTVLDYYVNNLGNKVILGFKEEKTYLDKDNAKGSGAHFVWVIGREGNDWTVADPGWRNTTGGEPDGTLSSLNAHIETGFQTTGRQQGRVMREFVPSVVHVYRNNAYAPPGQTSTSPRNNGINKRVSESAGIPTIKSFTVAAQGAVEVLITDPQGRRIGYDISSLSNVSEIPGGGYEKSLPISPDDDSDVDEGPGTVTCYINNPSPGTYSVALIGVGTGVATMHLDLSGAGGGVQSSSTTVNVASGVVTTKQIEVPSVSDADINVTQSAMPDVPQIGSNYVYTLKVKNNGPANATGVQLSDDLPVNAKLVSMTSDRGTCNVTYVPNVWCDIGSLAVGETATVTVTISVSSVRPLINSVRVNAFERDATIDNNVNVLTSVAGQSTFNGWEKLHFTETELADPTISGILADPDSDGISNILEYAFGSDPKSPRLNSLPQTAVVDGFNEDSGDPAQYLTLTFTRMPSAHNLSYVVEGSENLLNWVPINEANASIINYLDGSQKVTIQDSMPLNGTTARFLHLKVTQP